ncbi:uncharacterized protein VP01_13927g1, partial [Puccinia sorghi]
RPRLIGTHTIFAWIMSCQTTQFYRLISLFSHWKFLCAHEQGEVCTIRGDPIFLPKGNKPQAPVEWKLLLMLANLGVLGTAGGSAFLSNVFGISVGSVFNYAYCCLQALILRKKEFVSWPTSEQHAAL